MLSVVSVIMEPPHHPTTKTTSKPGRRLPVSERTCQGGEQSHVAQHLALRPQILAHGRSRCLLLEGFNFLVAKIINVVKKFVYQIVEYIHN